MEDQADLVLGQDSGHVGGAGRVVEIPVAGGQVVRSAEFDRDVARETTASNEPMGEKPDYLCDRLTSPK